MNVGKRRGQWLAEKLVVILSGLEAEMAVVRPSSQTP